MSKGRFAHVCFQGPVQTCSLASKRAQKPNARFLMLGSSQQLWPVGKMCMQSAGG